MILSPSTSVASGVPGESGTAAGMKKEEITERFFTVFYINFEKKYISI